MSVFIHCIETAVPDACYEQDFIGQVMERQAPEERQRRYIRRIYRNSGIERRFSVIRDFVAPAAAPFLQGDGAGRLCGPDTARRNDRFIAESVPLGLDVAGRALGGAGFDSGDVSHLITVTCTGFFNPGLDFHLARRLGLPGNVQRFNLGFMGCYAAMPALRMAEQFCRADPQAVVLVVCVELCTLHLQFDGRMDSILANSLFADGAAAAIVSGRAAAQGPSLSLDGFASALIPGGEGEMAWRIGNQGFDLVLSQYVPEIIGREIDGLVGPVLGEHGVGVGDVTTWAIHPGGKAILDRVERALGLDPQQIESSRRVLREYGNMSSATILFVLRDLLLADREGPAAGRILAMAFGPGLTVETALLTARLSSAARTFAPGVRSAVLGPVYA